MAGIEDALAVDREVHRLGDWERALQAGSRITYAEPDDAEEGYRRALRLRPDSVDAHCNLAALLAARGKADQAHAHAELALLLPPGAPATHARLGTSLLKLGQYEEALACLREALRVRPDDVDCLNNLGNALWRLDRGEESEAAYRQALRLRPGDYKILSNLGIALKLQGRAEEAEGYYRGALEIEPRSVETWTNLGVVLQGRGAVDEAMDCLERALRLQPDSPDTHNNLGAMLGDQGRQEEALAHYEQALRFRPDYPEAHRNRAMVRLWQGDFERGWPEYEWRLQCKGHPWSDVRRPRWKGEDLGGRTILLHAEQGLGDTMQFVRYAPLVQGRGGRVLVVCPPPLVRLLARCPGVDQVLPSGAVVPDVAVQAPLMSLPAILGTTLTTVPAAVPYLSAAPEEVERWKPALGSARGFKVGIAWQGNPLCGTDRRRSFPLAQLAPLAGLPGVRLISLQKGEGTEQLRELDGRFPVEQLDGRGGEALGDFMDTAAVVQNLDLVVAPDTAVAHLAGALGVRTWVALPFAAEWRWMAGREDSPWYPTMRLFRQGTAGDWDEVFRRMAETLRQELA